MYCYVLLRIDAVVGELGAAGAAEDVIPRRGVIPKRGYVPKGRGVAWPKSNFAAFSGKGHEAIFEFHGSPLPGGSPRRRISLALLQPTPGNSTRAATRWCERIRWSF